VPAFAGGASAIDDAIVAAYRTGPIMLHASVLRLIGWAADAGEVWLVMQALGKPLGMIDAFILESLGSGVRAAAFMLPGALGALEGSFVLFGALFGLPADTALAISCLVETRARVGLGSAGVVCLALDGGAFISCAGACQRTPIIPTPVRSIWLRHWATATD
jgi:hypothetical protein